MEISANPDVETLKAILIVSGALIMIMLAIVGYFINRQIEALTSLGEHVNTLNMVVSTLKTQLDLESPVTERRLNDHSKAIDDHENRITVLETEHRMHHFKKKIV